MHRHRLQQRARGVELVNGGGFNRDSYLETAIIALLPRKTYMYVRARAFSFIPSIYFHLRDPTGAISDVVRGPSRQLECCYSEVYLTRVGRGVVFE